MIRSEPSGDRRAEICAEVLADLPAWFGRPASNQAYIALSRQHPMLVGTVGRETVGFITLVKQTDHAMELAVMGVKRPFHRKGIGSALVTGALDRARGEQCRYLTVKTVADTVDDGGYRATRAFYNRVGFIALEVFPDLWDPDTPCLFLIKPVGNRD